MVLQNYLGPFRNQMLSFINRYIDDNDICDNMTGDPLGPEGKQKFKERIALLERDKLIDAYLSYVQSYMKGLDFYETRERDSNAKYRIVGKKVYRIQKKILFFYITLRKKYNDKYDAFNALHFKLKPTDIFLFDKFGNAL